MPSEFTCQLLNPEPQDENHICECGWPAGHTNPKHKCSWCGEWFEVPLFTKKMVLGAVVKAAFYD